MTVPGHPLKPLRTVDLLGYDGYCMILEMSKFYNPLRYHQPFHRRRLTDGILIVVFFYLILYSIFNTLYLHWTPPLEPPQPGEYNIRNVTVKHVDCLFSISSQYQRAPRYICYFLLIFTFVSRNYEWLAAGAAASVLTYSGVTVIHLFILFATNNKLNMPNAKTHCESLPIPGQSAPFVACAGVHETDVDLATNILSNVMFAALPVAAWSKTFRGSRSKAVLVSWLVFLAVGHTLNTLISPNWSAHFQICAKDHVESVSAANFQATLLDQNWRESFRSLVGVSQQDYHSALNSSLPACIYSCFITEGYIGRKAQDIRVLEGVISGTGTILKTTSTSRHFAIVFWWLYTFLAFLTLMTTEKQRWLPKWMYVRLLSIRYPQAWVGIASISMKRVKHVLSVEHREADLPVTVLDGSIGYTSDQRWNILWVYYPSRASK